MKQLKKIAVFAALLAALCSTARAGNVTVAWDQYVQSGTNVVVDKIFIYATTGTNAVFAPGNTNSLYIASTSVTNTTHTLSNLTAGAWTIVATAKSTSANLESVNSNPVWTILPLNSVGGLRVVVSP